MSYKLPLREEYLAPDYWDGIDINNDAHFADAGQTTRATLTRREAWTAARDLAHCIAEVGSGEYTEIDYLKSGSFDPSQTGLPDGSVVILDREFLMRWMYPPEHDREWLESKFPSSPAIREPFAEYWRQNQGTGNHFGDEDAVFLDEKIVYARYLAWGVLISRSEEARFVKEYGLGAAHVYEDGARVPAGGGEMFRRAKKLPLEVGTAIPTIDVELPDFALRSVGRVRGIDRIHPAIGIRERDATLKERLAYIRDAIGRVAIPKPAPEPTYP